MPERLLRRLALAAQPRAAAEPASDLKRPFIEACRAVEAPSVLELGTLRSIEGRSTMHRDWVPHALEFLGTDVEAGADVELVADAHRLSEATGPERFDVIISCSTFEHLKYPHLAAHEVLKSLKVGGLLYVQTHQSFPLHGYPSDYFRFSTGALAALFGTEMGFTAEAAGYDFPVRLLARREPSVAAHTAWLNTTLWGRKREPTPDDLRYELG